MRYPVKTGCPIWNTNKIRYEWEDKTGCPIWNTNKIRYEWEDKAGGYAIQGVFAKHVKRIEGDYYNVVGLPISRVYRELYKLGIEL